MQSISQQIEIEGVKMACKKEQLYECIENQENIIKCVEHQLKPKETKAK